MPLMTLLIFVLLGSFLGALATDVSRGIKNKHWFGFEKKKILINFKLIFSNKLKY
tara:strand:+ start:359 stop:523 length:165 start_codon:yes stop_codon:yes gene_type:complete